MVAASAVALALSGCGASAKHYDRVGIAGASVALTGVVLSLIAHSTTAPSDPAHRPLVGTGAGLQVGGLLLGVYALDGLIRVTSERP